MASSQKTGVLKGRWTVWALAIFFALLAGLGTLTLLGQAAERVEYYVVTENVAAGTAITPAVVGAVSVPADAMPQTALTLEDVTSGQFYSKIPLQAGTILVASVVTLGTQPLADAIPEGYVLASLLVSPENAAGGRVQSGDYVDVVAYNSSAVDPVARVVLHRVLVFEVSVAPGSVADAANTELVDPTGAAQTDNRALYGGEPQLYTFAVSPQDMVRLALIRNLDVYLALTSAPAGSSVDAGASVGDMFAEGSVGASAPERPSDTPAAADTTGVAADAQAFYDQFTGQGLEVRAGDGKLIAYGEDGLPVEEFDLLGGSFDPQEGYVPAP
jgi:Flp pilus assembly protein CpaB